MAAGADAAHSLHRAACRAPGYLCDARRVGMPLCVTVCSARLPVGPYSAAWTVVRPCCRFHGSGIRAASSGGGAGAAPPLVVEREAARAYLHTLMRRAVEPELVHAHSWRAGEVCAVPCTVQCSLGSRWQRHLFGWSLRGRAVGAEAGVHMGQPCGVALGHWGFEGFGQASDAPDGL
jgi:hypothetical protein